MYFIVLYFIVIFLFYSIVCFYWRVFIFTVVVESVISVIVEYRHLLPAGSESNHPSMSFPVEQSRAECATAAAAAAAWVLSDSAWASNTGERPSTLFVISLLEIRRIWEGEKLFISWLSFVLGEKQTNFSTLLCSLSSLFGSERVWRRR